MCNASGDLLNHVLLSFQYLVIKPVAAPRPAISRAVTSPTPKTAPPSDGGKPFASWRTEQSWASGTCRADRAHWHSGIFRMLNARNERASGRVGAAPIRRSENLRTASRTLGLRVTSIPVLTRQDQLAIRVSGRSARRETAVAGADGVELRRGVWFHRVSSLSRMSDAPASTSPSSLASSRMRASIEPAGSGFSSCADA